MLSNLFYFLEDINLCGELAPALRLVGIVILGVKIVVPIILIVVGMIDLAKAVTEKSDDKIKAAQNSLIKKAIVAVLVFLVVTIVGVLMTLVGQNDYKECTGCLVSPFDETECAANSNSYMKFGD